MNCPVDGTPLVMSDRQGIEIDYCPKCRGVWLDRGELDKIIERSAAVETQGLQPRPPAPLGEKRKNDDPYYYGDDDRRHEYDDDDRRYGDQRGYPPKKRKSFLGEMFDIFD
ncbi:MAG: zf-TFIIB domain-containing protein [Anaerolinea sp.]|nr:zf-TFIIB domain-containing protein [Anaerolinea sp.]